MKYNINPDATKMFKCNGYCNEEYIGWKLKENLSYLKD